MPRARPQFVVVDTETTGLDPLTDRVIDIGAVRLDADLDVVDRFTTLVDPGVPVPLFVTRLTGISDADLAGAPGAAEALAGLREFAGDAVLVGHNAAFDREHLAAAARRAGVAPLAGDWFDTLDAALLLYPELDRHALPDPRRGARSGVSRPPGAARRRGDRRRARAPGAARGRPRRGGAAPARERLVGAARRARRVRGGSGRGSAAPRRRRAAGGAGPAGRAPGRRRRLARGAGRRGRSAARARTAGFPAFAGAPARWSTRKPPKTSSATAASACSRPAPAWARASATCCRRPSPARPPAAASSSAPRPRRCSASWRAPSSRWSRPHCRPAGAGPCSWAARTTSAGGDSTRPWPPRARRSPTRTGRSRSRIWRGARAAATWTSRRCRTGPRWSSPRSRTSHASCGPPGPPVSGASAPRAAAATGASRGPGPRRRTWSA